MIRTARSLPVNELLFSGRIRKAGIGKSDDLESVVCCGDRGFEADSLQQESALTISFDRFVGSTTVEHGRNIFGHLRVAVDARGNRQHRAPAVSGGTAICQGGGETAYNCTLRLTGMVLAGRLSFSSGHKISP